MTVPDDSSSENEDRGHGHGHKGHIQQSMETFKEGMKRAILVVVIGLVIGAVEFGTTSILAEMIVAKFSIVQVRTSGAFV
jgi:hypothetical protein